MLADYYYVDAPGPITTFYQPIEYVVSKLPIKAANAYGDYQMWWLRANRFAY